MVSDRTRLGLAIAKARDRGGGRPTVMTPERIALARSMREQTPWPTWETIAAALGVGVGVSSVRRARDQAEDAPAGMK